MTEKSEMRRANLVALLDEPASTANLTEIADLLASGFRSGTFYRSGATGVLRARAQSVGIDPDPYVAILDQVPVKWGGTGWPTNYDEVR